MNKSELFALILGIVMLSVFFFAVLLYSKEFKQDVPECIAPDEIYERGELVEIKEGEVYQLKYLARMWSFEPSTVTIPAGSEVDIYLASKDIVHGLYVRGTNINLMAVPGALNFQSVRFTKPGTYNVYCHEYCGIGHQMMRAQIIVTP